MNIEITKKKKKEISMGFFEIIVYCLDNEKYF